MAALVVKVWKVSEDGSGDLVNIQARQPGLAAWLLDLMGVSTVTSLRVTSDFVHFEQGNFEGSSVIAVPATKITGVTHGHKKPLREALFLGLVLGALTFWALGIGAIVGVIYYFMSKSLHVGVMVGGTEYSIPFKATSVSGQTVDGTAAEEVANLIRSKMTT